MQKLPFVLLGLLALAAPAAARENWQGMKPGLTPVQAITLLGRPLVENKGHGYEVWFFDHEGEVTLYHGSVLYWTAPKVDTPQSAPAAMAAAKKPAAPASMVVQDKRSGPAAVRDRPRA